MSSLQAELQAAFDAQSPAAFKIARCEHCGETGAGGETYCECARVLAEFGACGCDCCGIKYGLYETLDTFIDSWKAEGNPDPELQTYCYYEGGLKVHLPRGCDKCSSYYIAHREWMWSEWNQFRDVYERRNFWKLVELGILDEPPSYDDDYDEPCRSGGGGICPCCGD